MKHNSSFRAGTTRSTTRATPLFSNSKLLTNMPADLDSKAKKFKIMRTIIICLIPCLFISIPVSAIFFQAFAITFTAFGLLFVGIPTLMCCLIIGGQYDAIVRIRNQIKEFDMVEIDELVTTTIGRLDMIMLVRQLIATGNLNGYTLVEDSYIVKDGVSMQPKVYNSHNENSSDSNKEDVISTQDSKEQDSTAFKSTEGSVFTSSLQDIVYCENCGNKITTSDKFCNKCGSQNSKYKY